MNKRLAFVDALRGFAALYVVCYHIIYVPQTLTKLVTPSWFDSFIELGFTGVTLFFIVSAFTLCLTLDGRSKEPNWILKFYFRRAGRILPLYYSWLILMIVISIAFYGVNFMHRRIELVSYIFFAFNFQPGRQEGLVWASWTLGVEMVFYLLFPFILIMVNNLKKSIVFIFVTLLISFIHFRIGIAIPSYKIMLGFFHHLPVFALGITTYYLYKNHSLKINSYKNYLLLGSLGMFILSSYLGHSIPLLIFYATAFSYSLLLLGLSQFKRSIFINKLTIFFGLISYSLYLNHLQIVNYLGTNVYRNFYHTMNLPIVLKLLTCYIITIVPLIIISYLTYTFIEKPGSKLMHSIAEKVIARRRFLIVRR